MKKYIGTKFVEARPALCEKDNQMNKKGDAGYDVLYPDGYISWSPKKAFEDSYRRTSEMTFGLAIESLKIGRKVARRGWNGKNMYLWLLPAANVKAEWCKEPHLKLLAEEAGGEVECLNSIRMRTADGKVLTGWLASQSDVFADDWIVVE